LVEKRKPVTLLLRGWIITIVLTVIGEEVNLASSLEAMNKAYQTQIILSERTVRLLKEGDLPAGWDLKFIEAAAVRGMAEPVNIYTLGREEMSESA
jgi:class 3 adenylate cyclase